MLSFQTHIRTFLKKLTFLTKVNNFNIKPTNKPCSNNLNNITSSFTTMDVSTQLKHVFNFFDIDRDGKISQMELTNVLLNLGQEKSTATIEAEGILKEVDFNGDGFIDLDEFMSIMDGSKPGFDGSKEDKCCDDVWNAFLVFDSDKNGLISAKELQQVFIRLGCSKLKIGECRKMIEGVDKDGDGFVDFDEFKSMMCFGIN